MKRTWGDKDKDMLALNQIVQIPDAEMADWVKQVEGWADRVLPADLQASLAGVRNNHIVSTRGLRLVRDVAHDIMGALADRKMPGDNDIDLLNDWRGSMLRWQPVVIGINKAPALTLAIDGATDYGIGAKVLLQLETALADRHGSIRRCEVCGYPFHAQRPDQIYCSRRDGLRRAMQNRRAKTTENNRHLTNKSFAAV